MRKTEDYADLAAQAENAVKGVKDPELRRVAFEKILDNLLSGGTVKSPRTNKVKKAGAGADGVKKSSKGPKPYVSELVEEGFFKKPKTIAEVRAELGNRGHHIVITSLSGPLQSLCQERRLRRDKRKTKGNKEVYSYSEW